MFGLDPFSRPVAITEILLLLTLAAFIGWLLGRLIPSGRISSLRASIADKESELEECRRSKVAGKATVVPPVRSVPVVETPPAFVHADPLLPAISFDDTPDPIDVVEAPLVVSAPVDVPVVVVPPVVAPAPELSPVGSPMPIEARVTTGNSEAAVLNRIASRASEINFDRIGRAVASEADDLKDIVGIGPFLERKLHSLGIYTFRQVANFTKEDIDKVNEIIEFFPGRIERDNWVEQSKEFYDRKYGSKS
ncbi:hypothetical protein EXU85_18065 [Spirosoma sp. KCTC 42546]|uniref:hypothetical protein n=1 Tax=Spirosoma sp. KCTC 42546 TaxID=2520506 RepID=UPI0011586F89|nr:hypothetical protein [Spirosoma sp. KCTC 42546]QDK80406.1 hypothetical protein EXU85_18065 [Spirosoma sp. KCTC 42546]